MLYFQKKNWVSQMGHTQVHESICKLLACFNEDEKKLMLELCERYDWITLNSYSTHVKTIFDGLIEKEIVPRGKIYLFPLKSKEDRTTSKSGDTLIYMFQGFIQFLQHPFNQSSIYSIIEGLEKITSSSFIMNPDDYFFIIDDFLGTGDSLLKVLEEIKQEGKISVEKIIVVALVAHKKALTILEDLDIRYSVSLIRDKGISDYYEEPLKSEKINTMKKIESKVTSNKKMKFGYKASEGLITMIRTPNNTFPIFWLPYKFGEFKLDPPFPRLQINKL